MANWPCREIGSSALGMAQVPPGGMRVLRRAAEVCGGIALFCVWFWFGFVVLFCFVFFPSSPGGKKKQTNSTTESSDPPQSSTARGFPPRSAVRRTGGEVKFPPRWRRLPRRAAPAPHWHRAPGRSVPTPRGLLGLGGSGSGGLRWGGKRTLFCSSNPSPVGMYLISN